MADYPSIVQAFGTQVKDGDGTKLDLAVSGKPRLRTYFTQIRSRVKVVHDLDDTDMATLDAHYTADQKNAFLFNFLATDPATQYTVRYVKTLTKIPKPGNRWAVTVDLIVT